MKVQKPRKKLLIKLAKNVLIVAGFLMVPLTAFSADATLRMLIWEGYAPDNYIEKFNQHIQKKYKKSVAIEKTFVSVAEDFFNGLRDKKYEIIAPSHNIIKDKRFNFRLYPELPKGQIPSVSSYLVHRIPFIQCEIWMEFAPEYLGLLQSRKSGLKTRPDS